MPKLPVGPVRGTVAVLLIAGNTIGHALPLLALALVQLAVPHAAFRRRVRRTLTSIAENWITCNGWVLATTGDTRWEFRGLGGLRRGGWYLVISNHRSWVDILALQAAFNRRVPFLKFFIKDQLRWVPVLGLAWWALDMPFMKRYSREQLARRPELRGTDLRATRRACERFKESPTSVLNFVEGTRFTPAKRAAGGSPHRHLLTPRAGGIAFVLGALGPVLTELLDVTIVYPDGAGGFWDLCAGRVRQVVLEVERRALPAWLSEGDYVEDAAFRARFQEWLAALWRAKDERLDLVLGGAASDAPESGDAAFRA